MMLAGAALGAGLTKLNATEKVKMEERLMVQRLRNQSILPRASVPPRIPTSSPSPPGPTHGRKTPAAGASLPCLSARLKSKRWVHVCAWVWMCSYGGRRWRRRCGW
jgi:hypothetical protein